MNCLHCSSNLKGKQTKYCSRTCKDNHKTVIRHQLNGIPDGLKRGRHPKDADPICKCGQLLTDENWPKSLKNRNAWICKKCNSEYYKSRGYKHDLNKRKEWRKANPITYCLSRIKQRAKNKNIPFNIDKEDIFIPEYCPALGIKLEYHTIRARDNSPSLDRINPSLGYVKGNVVVISLKANRIKNDATAEELMLVAEWLYKVKNE